MIRYWNGKHISVYIVRHVVHLRHGESSAEVSVPRYLFNKDYPAPYNVDIQNVHAPVSYWFDSDIKVKTNAQRFHNRRELHYHRFTDAEIARSHDSMFMCVNYLELRCSIRSIRLFGTDHCSYAE